MSQVSVGVYSVLNVAELTALSAGPFDSVVPQSAVLPFTWFTVSASNARGMGMGGLRLIDIRVHAASPYGGAKEVQNILAAAVHLLEDTALTVSGYAQGGLVFFAETVEPFDSLINGKQCVEAAANFYTWVEPS